MSLSVQRPLTLTVAVVMAVMMMSLTPDSTSTVAVAAPSYCFSVVGLVNKYSNWTYKYIERKNLNLTMNSQHTSMTLLANFTYPHSEQPDTCFRNTSCSNIDMEIYGDVFFYDTSAPCTTEAFNQLPGGGFDTSSVNHSTTTLGQVIPEEWLRWNESSSLPIIGYRSFKSC